MKPVGFQPGFFDCSSKNGECWENEIIKVGCLCTFLDRWMTYLATHRQKKVQAMSWKNLQMLEFCHFTWSWMGPINCAPNPKVYYTVIYKKNNICIVLSVAFLMVLSIDSFRNSSSCRLKKIPIYIWIDCIYGRNLSDLWFGLSSFTHIICIYPSMAQNWWLELLYLVSWKLLYVHILTVHIQLIQLFSWWSYVIVINIP